MKKKSDVYLAKLRDYEQSMIKKLKAKEKKNEACNRRDVEDAARFRSGNH
jgi:hypothetical protein